MCESSGGTETPRAEGWEAPLGPAEEFGFVRGGHGALLSSGQEDGVRTVGERGEQRCH